MRAYRPSIFLTAGAHNTSAEESSFEGDNPSKVEHPGDLQAPADHSCSQSCAQDSSSRALQSPTWDSTFGTFRPMPRQLNHQAPRAGLMRVLRPDALSTNSKRVRKQTPLWATGRLVVVLVVVGSWGGGVLFLLLELLPLRRTLLELLTNRPSLATTTAPTSSRSKRLRCRCNNHHHYGHDRHHPHLLIACTSDESCRGYTAQNAEHTCTLYKIHCCRRRGPVQLFI